MGLHSRGRSDDLAPNGRTLSSRRHLAFFSFRATIERMLPKPDVLAVLKDPRFIRYAQTLPREQRKVQREAMALELSIMPARDRERVLASLDQKEWAVRPKCRSDSLVSHPDDEIGSMAAAATRNRYPDPVAGMVRLRDGTLTVQSSKLRPVRAHPTKEAPVPKARKRSLPAWIDVLLDVVARALATKQQLGQWTGSGRQPPPIVLGASEVTMKAASGGSIRVALKRDPKVFVVLAADQVISQKRYIAGTEALGLFSLYDSAGKALTPDQRGRLERKVREEHPGAILAVMTGWVIVGVRGAKMRGRARAKVEAADEEYEAGMRDERQELVVQLTRTTDPAHREMLLDAIDRSSEQVAPELEPLIVRASERWLVALAPTTPTTEILTLRLNLEQRMAWAAIDPSSLLRHTKGLLGRRGRLPSFVTELVVKWLMEVVAPGRGGGGRQGRAAVARTLRSEKATTAAARKAAQSRRYALRHKNLNC